MSTGSATRTLREDPLLRVKQNQFEDLVERGMFQQAARLREELVRLRDDPYMDLVNRAYLSRKQRDFDGAAKALDSALSLDPMAPLARVELYHLYLNTKRVREAERLLESFLAEFPSHPYYLGKFAFFLYAYKAPDLAKEERDRLWAKAERLADDVLSADPLNINALRTSGGIKIDQARFEEAEELIERALALDPTNADAHFLIAEIHQKHGRYREAIPHLEVLIDRWPNSRTTLADLTFAREKLEPFSWRWVWKECRRHARGLARTGWRLIVAHRKPRFLRDVSKFK